MCLSVACLTDIVAPVFLYFFSFCCLVASIDGHCPFWLTAVVANKYSLSHSPLHGHIRHILPQTTSLSHLRGCTSPNSVHFCLTPTKRPRQNFFRRPGGRGAPATPASPGYVYDSDTRLFTSDVKFVSESSHVSAVVAVPTTGVSDLSVVDVQTVLHDGKATVAVILKTSIDIHVDGAPVGHSMNPVHFAGPCCVAPQQYRLTFLYRDATISTSCCIQHITIL